MTGELSFLKNIVSIPPCLVGFADGNKTYATHTGVFYISNRIVLTNVLFVPNLNCSLISVSKLLRQTNCFVLLTYTLCVLHDRFTRTLIGISGEERDGFYYFKDVMAARAWTYLFTAMYQDHIRLVHLQKLSTFVLWLMIFPEQSGLIYFSRNLRFAQSYPISEKWLRNNSLKRSRLFEATTELSFCA